MSRATFSFSVDPSSRGYHEYQSIWLNPSRDDELTCEREVGNAHDTHAVAIKKHISGVLTTVGHIPKKISKVSSIFIRRGGTIQCKVNGHRRYSADLEKGGLEIPCILTYIIDDEKEWTKTKDTVSVKLGLKTADCLTDLVLNFHVSTESPTVPPAAMKSVCPLGGSVSTVDVTAHCSTQVDQSPPKKKQKSFCEEEIIMGQELSDLEINLAQELLRIQYPKLNGLQSTLFQERKKLFLKNFLTNCIQIVHCQARHHWVTASTVNCKLGAVKVFDTVFNHCDKETTEVIHSLFATENCPELSITMGRCQRQKGGKDCGLYSIAIATALAFGLHPSKQKFNQSAMRVHLVRCFTAKQMTPFPCN